MREKLFSIISTILIIAIVLGSIFLISYSYIKYSFRKEYSEYVEKYAKEENVDELLIYSIIKAESGFDKDATSNSEARGLMQLMKNTAAEVAVNNEIDAETVDLYDPETNVKLGTKYFKTLCDKYDNNIMLALVAYNAGIGNTDKWIKDGIIINDENEIEVAKIPFNETKNYVSKTMNYYSIYQMIYN